MTAIVPIVTRHSHHGPSKERMGLSSTKPD
jgi:hypothetical protein